MTEIEHCGAGPLEQIPGWAWDVLAAPGGRPLQCESGIFQSAGRPIGRIDCGILRFELRNDDPSTEYYRAIGGAHFHERSTSRYAMSALDTPVYHHYIREFAPDSRDSTVVDVGGGDGRNALPWLKWGFKRVIVVDSAGAALARFRARVAAENRKWLDNILLIEGDAGAMPLASGLADRVMAIESLYYLNEGYEQGLRECHRVMRPQARLLLADRKARLAAPPNRRKDMSAHAARLTVPVRSRPCRRPGASRVGSSSLAFRPPSPRW